VRSGQPAAGVQVRERAADGIAPALRFHPGRRDARRYPRRPMLVTAQAAVEQQASGTLAPALAAAGLAFLVGSLPTAWIVVRALLGIDVRSVGSGNVGATNASRAFTGRRAQLGAFFAIYFVDFAKGLLPVLLLPGAVFAAFSAPTPAAGGLVAVSTGVAAVLGHCFCPWLGGRGGKGVATTTGVFAALEPLAFVVSLVAFGLVRKATGQVFWGSLALGLALPATTILRDPATAFTTRLPVSVTALAIAAFLIWTHRSNLRGHFAARSAEASS
jgi:glycerol-3-phosphate acyltransferase PlsY